ncbi:uncharacterized protein [Primulina huaijiensis]|uniref:uncharacterized protein n=1 Tax=Primulina huaijiensis TaxID=1492673 RepID=UPI003CC7014C
MDCCLVANEVVEEHRKKKKKGWVFKVDFGKAYDNVDWRFLEFVLQKKGFGERWRKWIRVDALGRLVDKAKELNEVRGPVVGRENLKISHIQFVDDTLFLLQTERHVMAMVEIIKLFEQKSGLKINFEKSVVLGINCEDEVFGLAQAIG